MAQSRVVITGMGAVSPVGSTAPESWAKAKAGIHGISPIGIEAEDFPIKLAAQVKDFDAAAYLGKKEARRLDRYAQFAMVAAQEAMLSAGLVDVAAPIYDGERLAVVVSSGLGGIATFETEHEKFLKRGPNGVSPFFIPMLISNIAAGQIAIRYGAKGHCAAITTACASSAHAIGEAYRLLQRGDADIAITGGAEACISPLILSGFTALQALCKGSDPARASIPFDRERSGFVMGEGGAIVILERLESAIARGAKPLAEVVGYGSTCDAFHITSPAEDGEGASRAMSIAMREAGVSPGEVGYVNAHGTSTPLNDKFETLAVKKAFGAAAAKVAMSSTKGVTGHMLGAAGAIEAIFCAYALLESFLPPTAGFKEIDPNCDLDVIPLTGRAASIEFALSNSLGFGGHNASLLFKKWQ